MNTPTLSKNMSPILIQNAPHIVFMTLTSTSRALKPYNPAMNWLRPPQKKTKGKKMVGESPFPNQPAIHAEVMNVEPAKPARPSAAGGAMGCRNIVT